MSIVVLTFVGWLFLTICAIALWITAMGAWFAQMKPAKDHTTLDTSFQRWLVIVLFHLSFWWLLSGMHPFLKFIVAGGLWS